MKVLIALSGIALAALLATGLMRARDWMDNWEQIIRDEYHDYLNER